MCTYYNATWSLGGRYSASSAMPTFISCSCSTRPLSKNALQPGQPGAFGACYTSVCPQPSVRPGRAIRPSKSP